MLDPALGAMLRGVLALLLLGAAGHKLRDLPGFQAAVHGYGLLPGALVPTVARGLAGVELSLALCLLVPGLGSLPGLGAAALLVLYSGAIAINLYRGRRDIDCGCAGPAGSRRLGPGLLARNGLLLAAALASTLPVASRPLVWLDGFTVVAGIVVAWLLHGAAEAAQGTAPKLAVLRGEW